MESDVVACLVIPPKTQRPYDCTKVLVTIGHWCRHQRAIASMRSGWS